MRVSSVLLSGLAVVVSARIVERGDEVVFVHDTTGVVMSVAEAYTSGEVHMSLMNAITKSVDDMRINGLIDPVAANPVTEFTPCVNGFSGKGVNNTYMCNNLDMYSFTPHSLLGSTERVGNDIWGWAYEENGETREFGMIGQQDGTAFVEILSDGQVVYLGRLPTQSVTSLWRDIKVIGHYAYIGSEALGHGIQVFDLHKVSVCVSLPVNIHRRLLVARSLAQC